MGVLDKLKDVLFEKDEDEEEYEDEEYEEEVVAKPQPKPQVQAAPLKKELPVFTSKTEDKPKVSVINSVELTQPVPSLNKDKTPVFSKPETSSVFSKPEVKLPEAPVTAKPASEPVNNGFNLLADEPEETVKPKVEKKKPVTTGVYEFKPVISPMFGVDDKDMDAIQTSSRLKPEETHGVSQIISPIYGVSEEARPTNIQRTVEKSNYQETMSYSREAKATEDSIPEFSLDDILNARDNEFANSSAGIAANAVKDQPDVDETVVIDSRNMNPFCMKNNED